MLKDVFERAQAYVLDNGTNLQKVCCKFLVHDVGKQEFIEALEKYQNKDGGWANGLEIEYGAPISSPFTTAAALGYIFRFGLADTSIFQKTINYLKNVQYWDGKWDESDEILKYPHPPYMAPGVYPEYKTGMILKWLMKLKVNEEEMINKAKQYLIEAFNEISLRNDFWSAVGYSSAFSLIPETPEYAKIMEWCMKILMPKGGAIGWQQVMGMIEDDIPIPDRNFNEVIEMIKEQQEQDGGWPHAFGTYNRVWSSIFIIRFLQRRNLIQDYINE